MDLMKKSILSVFSIMLIIAAVMPQQTYAQHIKNLSWSIVKLDSTWNACGESVTGKIIAKYKPTIDPLMEVIGYTDYELDKLSEKHSLANLSTDILLDCAQKYLAKKGLNTHLDIALTNYGGIRTTIPAGNITSFDVLSVFPFDNRLVIFNLEGKYVRELMENFAKRGRVEAMAGVEMVVAKNQLEKCLIGGLPLDDAKIYRIATIDFLLSGGDSVYALKYGTDVIETGIIVRDAVIDYIKEQTRNGKEVIAAPEIRVIIKK
ncbi:MAG: 5'-nucleotidase C-terminal domain-containing protein [Bacteroidales bacterium]